MNKTLLANLLLITFSVPAFPQQPSPAPAPQNKSVQQPAQPQKPETDSADDTDVVRIRTNLVQVDAVVTKDGKQVTDLTADDFEIFEDGKKQVITNFSYVSNVAGPGGEADVKPVNKNKAVPFVPPAIRPEDPRRTIALVVDDMGISKPRANVAV